MRVVQVRIEGPTEGVVREAAGQMGVQVSRVCPRTDVVQLYGVRALPVTGKTRICDAAYNDPIAMARDEIRPTGTVV